MQIFTAYDDGKLTLFLQGELDHHEAKAALGTIDRLIDEYLPRDCIIELSRLTFMDSSGIALILKIYRRLKVMGGRAWVEHAEKQPLKVIEASGIERMLNVSLTKEA